MSRNQKIAILLRHPQRLSDACNCGRLLKASGADVVFCWLGRSQDLHEPGSFRNLLDTRFTCYTDDRLLACKYGVDCLSIPYMARLLETADWVVPF